MLFATFVKDDLFIFVLLGLFFIADGYKGVVVMFDSLINNLKRWRLDLNKYIRFGFNRASTLVEKKNSILIH